MLFYMNIVLKFGHNKSCVFLKICYHTEFHNPLLGDTSVSSIPEISIATVLVLLIVGN
jgi:hypothetical protein